MENYHAPTPATLKGATVVDTPQAFDLWTRKAAVFIDAIARPKRPADLPPYQPWSAEPRRDIPGSLWLADTGFRRAYARGSALFRNGARARDGRRQVQAHRLLLPHPLLGVLERRQARAELGLYERLLVSAGRRRLGEGGPSAGGERARAARNSSAQSPPLPVASRISASGSGSAKTSPEGSSRTAGSPVQRRRQSRLWQETPAASLSKSRSLARSARSPSFRVAARPDANEQAAFLRRFAHAVPRSASCAAEYVDARSRVEGVASGE